MSYVGVDTNISQPVVSQAPSGSGGFDSSAKTYVAGLNIPRYPDFKNLNPAGNAVQSIDNIFKYLAVAVAGVSIVWLIK